MSELPRKPSSRKVSTTKHRDEIKRDKVSKAKKEVILETIDNVTTAILDEPSLWTSPAFKPLRNFVHSVSSQPNVSPPSVNPSVTLLAKSNPENGLSCGFIKGIYNCLSTNIQSDPEYAPLLQITAVTNRYRSSYLDSIADKVQIKQTTLTAIDGDLNTITLKVASQMTSWTGTLTAGSIVKLLKYQRIYFDYKKGAYYMNRYTYHCRNREIVLM